jgi:ATP-dependent helicase/nuclease subunit B
MTNSHGPKIYNIPAGLSFTDTLAKGLLEKHQNKLETLSKTLILLPTRRATRSLREAFLRQTDGKPILLPKMQSFGDIDAEELLLSGQNIDDFSLQPAMPNLKRQILLAQIIEKIPNFTKSHAQNMALAQALGQLMDQIYTENLSLADLPNIVDREAFAAHWQITLDFLSILSEHWPKILEENGMIDAADRRNQLILMLNNHWEKNSPSMPVIAAGSTGSIPATAKLLKTISYLPEGEIILPGLDTHLFGEAWNDIEEGHPQTTLKSLLQTLECERKDVKAWPFITKDPNQIRERLFSHVMAPASHTDQWTKVHIDEKNKKGIQNSLKDLSIYNCETAQEEAQIIALIMRATLEEKNKTAALITPDRQLARRVSNLCQRWGIIVDDSAGVALSDTPIGLYIRLSAKALIQGIQPVSLLALLKHNYAAGFRVKNFRTLLRALDKDLLRGVAPAKGFDTLKKRFYDYQQDPHRKNKPDQNILEFLDHLQNNFNVALKDFSSPQSFKKLMQSHIKFMENLATSENKTGQEILWSGEDGEAASNFLSEVYDYTQNLSNITPQDYLLILEQFMRTITVRPKYGTHPRLMILGQLEARLVQTDIVILSGLNEGTWPPDSGNDPWMSRPMRKNYGLPLPERAITLAAHDFVQGVCSGKTYITRSEKQDGAPTVPARWLQRLYTFLSSIEIDPKILEGQKYKSYLRHLDQVDTKDVHPIDRPKPCPPLEARPKSLSVTRIETWLKDPYQIYATKILRLYKLDDLEKPFDAIERGNILHDILEEWTAQNPRELPNNPADEFIHIAKTIIDKNTNDETLWDIWKPRLIRISDWVINQETQWREKNDFIKSEATGSLKLKEYDFEIYGRADRIDKFKTGGYAIIDYKSGGTYSKNKLESAELNQLPLEALILESGGFHDSGLNKDKVSAISYWKMTGGKDLGSVTILDDEDKIKQSILYAQDGLTQLVKIFQNSETPYIAIPRLDNAPRFNDYAHLERIKEWATLGNDETDLGEVA